MQHRSALVAKRGREERMRLPFVRFAHCLHGGITQVVGWKKREVEEKKKKKNKTEVKVSRETVIFSWGV